jgi:hypothetical protein
MYMYIYISVYMFIMSRYHFQYLSQFHGAPVASNGYKFLANSSFAQKNPVLIQRGWKSQGPRLSKEHHLYT